MESSFQHITFLLPTTCFLTRSVCVHCIKSARKSHLLKVFHLLHWFSLEIALTEIFSNALFSVDFFSLFFRLLFFYFPSTFTHFPSFLLSFLTSIQRWKHFVQILFHNKVSVPIIFYRKLATAVAEHFSNSQNYFEWNSVTFK